MIPLYRTAAVRAGLGPCLRPGGETLTRRILELVRPAADALILDAGCGTGASMSLLSAHGIKTVLGLDLDPDLLAEARQNHNTVARADLALLPLPDGCLELILCECVWNLTEKKAVLAEFSRSLAPGGHLALSDIYARGDAPENGKWPVRCCFSQATGLEEVRDLFLDAGLSVEVLEDHTTLLTRTAAEFVFTHGSLKGFWQAVTGDETLAADACDAAAASRPGLFLLIARKQE